MIALLFALAAQTAPAQTVQTPSAPMPAAPLTLAPIGRQQLPAKGCAAYLWSVADRQLVAMATAEPATLRVSIGGRTLDLVRSGGTGTGRLGFPDGLEYRGQGITARLSMDVVQQEGLSAGARVPTGSLQVDPPGGDGIVVPVAGLIGCAT